MHIGRLYLIYSKQFYPQNTAAIPQQYYVVCPHNWQRYGIVTACAT